MSELVGVVGDTGTGKTHSLREIDPSTTVLIGTINKPPSFRGWKKKFTPLSKEGGNYLTAKAGGVLPYKVIGDALDMINKTRPEIKTIIIDDFQYLMAGEFMDKVGDKGWDKFNEMADHVYRLLMKCTSLREDIKVVIMTHDELVKTEDFVKIRKMKTIGKMLDDKITLEGLFTVVLFTHVEEIGGDLEYKFITQSDGITRAKSPAGMFEKLEPNNLPVLLEKMESYYNGD